MRGGYNYDAFMSGTAAAETPGGSRFRSLASFAPLRPWRELFAHPSSYSLPHSLADLVSRLRLKLGIFRMNYALAMLFILFLSLLWHPTSMIVFLLVFVAWFFLYFFRDGPLVVFSRIVDDRVVLVALSVVTVVCLVLTHVWLNVLISCLIGSAIVALHAAFRVNDDLFLNEDEAAESGLLSFAGGSGGSGNLPPRVSPKTGSSVVGVNL
ncbi:unnamed protein product [Cuscuta campestris]|uniref:PRA1 family protein n=1 Tax=Cuscuta campestris TaxID=132261 RepID=A0A484M1F2_9ASTE|nr:unnamed protein product [Cuscuta campestris]